jgi:glycosyltransferase involved in cell wall biosynthesis
MTSVDLRQALDTLAASPSWSAVADIARRCDAGPAGVGKSLFQEAVNGVEAAARALLDPGDGRPAFKITAETCIAARFLAGRVHPLRHEHYWGTKQAQFAHLFSTSADVRARVGCMMALVVCDTILEQPAGALSRFFERIVVIGPDRFLAGLPMPIASAGHTLLLAGFFTQTHESFRRTLSALAQHIADSDVALRRSWVAVAVLFFRPPAAPDMREVAFESFAVPMLEWSAANVDPATLDLVRDLDLWINGRYMRQQEGTERFKLIQGLIAPLFARIGAATRAAAGVKHAAHRHAPASPLRIAFVLQSMKRLAHAENLITFLRGLNGFRERAIEPRVYIPFVVDGSGPLKRALVELSTPLFTMPDLSRHPAIWLREMAARDGASAVVFVSVAAYLSFAAGLSIAPALVWWSMKYHGLEADGIDGYLTNGNFFDDWREIDGRRWRSCRAALPPLTGEAGAAERRAFRAQHGLSDEHVVLACIGREEKMLDPAYIDAIGRVLDACPDARFMWAGRSAESPDVSALLRQRGIRDKCRFVGWLSDTKVAAQAMDIYADSFPFASGHTAYEAMAAGKPVVVLKTPEAIESSTATAIVPLYDGAIGTVADQEFTRRLFTDADGASLWPYVDTADLYVELIIGLVRDPGRRARAGAACRACVERFARDEVKFAETTSRHLIEIVRERLAGNDSLALTPNS